MKTDLFYSRNILTDLLWSLLWMVVIMLLLSAVFCIAEGSAQSDKCSSFLQALLWVFASSVDAPVHWRNYEPQTATGQIIALLVGVVKVAIIAIPTGLIVAIFSENMAHQRHKRHLEDCRKRMTDSFRSFKDKATGRRVPPRYLSVARLQVKKQLTEKDIMDTVAKYPEFRLQNLSATQKYSERPFDRLIVEMLPLGKAKEDCHDVKPTSYGIMIDRSSKITIIAPTAATECTIGYFAYHVALFGGFNFVSREFAEDGEKGYYTIGQSPAGKRQDFVSDIRQLSGTPEHWNIAMISSSDLYDTQVHLVSKVKQENREITSSVLHSDRFREFFLQLQEAMLQLEPVVRCEVDGIYNPVTPKNVIVRSGGGLENNGFTMRVSYKVTTWNDHIVSAAFSIAQAICHYLEKGDEENTPAHT